MLAQNVQGKPVKFFELELATAVQMLKGVGESVILTVCKTYSRWNWSSLLIEILTEFLVLNYEEIKTCSLPLSISRKCVLASAVCTFSTPAEDYLTLSSKAK